MPTQADTAEEAVSVEMSQSISRLVATPGRIAFVILRTDGSPPVARHSGSTTEHRGTHSRRVKRQRRRPATKGRN